MGNSKNNWVPPFFRLYLLKIISKTREIRCEECGSYEGIEMHHTKYYPEEVSINEIKLLCNKCHRNDSNQLSHLQTVFENDKRFCVGSNFKFEY